MEQNYYGKNIVLNEPATTIPVMEWIRDNGCPDLDHTSFSQRGMNINRGLIVSLEIVCDEEHLTGEMMLPPLSEWYDYEGMKRYHEHFWWYFYINGHLYFATE